MLGQVPLQALQLLRSMLLHDHINQSFPYVNLKRYTEFSGALEPQASMPHKRDDRRHVDDISSTRSVLLSEKSHRFPGNIHCTPKIHLKQCSCITEGSSLDLTHSNYESVRENHLIQMLDSYQCPHCYKPRRFCQRYPSL